MSSQNAGGTSLPILNEPVRHKDPVCGMMVAPEKAADKVERAGETYYFCSKGCVERFSREPEKFLAAPGTAGMGHTPAHAEHAAMQHTASTPSRAAADKKIRYTCPMHPEIIRFGPGNCSFCGMALVPMYDLAEVDSVPQYVSNRLHFCFHSALSLPILPLPLLSHSLPPP